MGSRVTTLLVVLSLVVVACTGPAALPTIAPAKPTAAAGTATAAPAATSTPAASAAGTPIKLGAIIPLTGPSGPTGQDMRDGYLLALEQVNAAGGVNGRPIELIIEDDKNDPATAVASFEKLVNNDRVEVLLGGLASTISAALIEPAKKAKPNMAWTGAAASSTVEKGFEGQDWFFHYHPWDYQNGESSLAFLKSVPAKTFAIAYEDGLFGQSGNKGFVDALPQQGQQVVASEAFKSGSGDYTAVINKLKASNADGLIMIPFANDMIPFLTQMRELGWKPKMIYASPPSFPPDFGKSPVAEGVSGLTLWTPDVPAPASKKFVEDFKKKYNKEPGSYWAPLAYTNLVTVVEALKKSGTGDQAKWVRAMAETKYDSPLGQELVFKPSQMIKYQGFTRLLSYQWQGGKQQIIFPENLATAKFVY